MSDFTKIIVPPTAKIIDVIEVIDKGALQIALVCANDRKLLGVVTDGDIRRGILRRVNLESSILNVMNSSPVSASENTSAKEIQKLMVEKKISHIPLLDELGRVVGMDFETVLEEKLEGVPVVLMAGGEGRRLYPLTKDVPKPMLKLGGRPILEIIIDNLYQSGVRQFYISVNYKSSVIKDYFGDGSSRNIEIHYLEEAQPLGTAGALSLLPQGLKKPFIVMNGDVLTRVHFKKLIDFHIKNEAQATMCLKSYEIDVPYGVVGLDGVNIERIDEKPVQKFFVNAGIYVFDPNVALYLKPDERIDMTTLYMRIKSSGAKVVGFPLHEYWVDIGRKSDLKKVIAGYGNEF